MGNLLDRVVSLMEEKRNRVINGGINSIPINFDRFRCEFPGIEQGMYYQITANTKVGKTQVADHMFLYETIKFAYNNKDKVRIHINYFTWEMSKEEKMIQAISRFLFEGSHTKIRIDPKTLRSVSSDRIIPEEILNQLKDDGSELLNILTFFEENVTFIDDIKNPTGIDKFIKSYAIANGKIHKKKIEFKNNDGSTKEIEVFDFYEPNDPEKYHIFIFDHLGLMSTESGKSLRECMQLVSSEYIIDGRNKYKFTFAAIIQQAAAQEGIENIKLNRMKPSLDGYGDNKTIARDANYILGLYSPFRYDIPVYGNYDIELFKDNIRFLELIAGREGGGGTICPLFFDGAVNFFMEMPRYNDQINLEKTKKLLTRVRSDVIIMMNYQQKSKNYLKKVKKWFTYLL